MPTVRFYPDNKEIEVEEGSTILSAARSSGVTIEAPCNGVGVCGKCKVKLSKESVGNVLQYGKHKLKAEEEKEGFVLACDTKIYGDISVYINDFEQKESIQILSEGKSFNVEIDSYIKKKYTEKKNVTKVFANGVLLTEEVGDTSGENYGVVIDIGTTTLVASLINLNNGEELASTSALNPQSVHAQDVLSRIKFASDENGLQLMYSEFINEANSMIGKVILNSGKNKDNIYEVIFSGNTCMIHLATNVNPYSLGKYPYTPLVDGDIYLSAKEHKLNISDYGLIYLPKIISSYVGADITSGVLAAEIHKEKGKILFIDIGTNGEMVFADNGKLSASSTAAGPAFEGMNITHGMRAGNGAIEYFDIKESGNIEIKTIGNVKPTGICGSGLLDIVGELVSYNIINESGRFAVGKSEEPLTNERLVKVDGKNVFMLTDKVYLSQKDVRQVQLAKGAIRTGIEFLLKSKNVKADEVDKVLIAGSFGYHLRVKSLLNIGLLPKAFEGKIEFIGNTSKSGGQVLLVNKNYRKEISEVVKEIEVIELSNYEDFDKVFVKNIKF
ncbi:ASKHA domain-containing protein [Clostridium cellulovorans]|uniref:Ferredoxin n=1 Tax=Clostridium cellulovorans (strain ATCC 35296 / DSM 3052 / OCM 3 / 743B) TaxID=573061 RepID=D9SUV0_CLOC7|nr:ASKHA domain-containing protein [Clostridium cellulovorans]ADL51005.1 ferredoxin [Clostridium cellulovorans 743B]